MKKHKIGDKVLINKIAYKQFGGYDEFGFSMKICAVRRTHEKSVFITGTKTIKSTKSRPRYLDNGRTICENHFIGSMQVYEVKESISRKPFYIPCNNFYEER